MIDLKDCDGCREDFYNDHNPYGVKECWHRKNGEYGTYRLIPIDLWPPYLHIKFERLPKCYTKPRHVKIGPNVLDAKGYWK